MVINETLSKDSSRKIITIKRRVLGKGGKQSRGGRLDSLSSRIGSDPIALY